MFVRRKNSSGVVSVQIFDKSKGVNRVVKTIGSVLTYQPLKRYINKVGNGFLLIWMNRIFFNSQIKELKKN